MKGNIGKTSLEKVRPRLLTMEGRYDRMAAWLLPRRKSVHVAIFFLTLLMIPGAMTALQPIDMESYEMESPELTAQTVIDEEFPNSEIILGGPFSSLQKKSDLADRRNA